jgi:hypothetical protein
MMVSVRNVYLGAMALGGLALALASVKWPAVNDGAVPPLMSLLMISLAFDLILMNRAKAGLSAPLQMNTRVIGFIAGALIYFFLRKALVE